MACRALPVLLCLTLVTGLPAVAGAKTPPREPDDGPDPRPGRFCGLVSRRIVRGDATTGRRRVVRRVRRRSCFFSRELSVGLRLTYASAAA